MLYTFARFAGDDSAICGVDVSLLDAPADAPPLAIDEIDVAAAEDPIGHFVRRYAQVEKWLANGQVGSVAVGTDFNGLNGLMDMSELALPADATTASACPVAGGIATSAPQALSVMRFRNMDGSVGAQVRIDERGLATYGLLADMMSIIRDYPDCGADVYDSLMLSAEATLRAWEQLDPTTAPKRTPLPVLGPSSFTCKTVPGVP
jgi:hypothetical protein